MFLLWSSFAVWKRRYSVKDRTDLQQTSRPPHRAPQHPSVWERGEMMNWWNSSTTFQPTMHAWPSTALLLRCDPEPHTGARSAPCWRDPGPHDRDRLNLIKIKGKVSIWKSICWILSLYLTHWSSKEVDSQRPITHGGVWGRGTGTGFGVSCVFPSFKSSFVD